MYNIANWQTLSWCKISCYFNYNLGYYPDFSQGGRGRKRNTLSTTVSEGIGSVRICGIATFTGTEAANVTIVVTIGTQSGTASKL